jgi:hypothetical protein
VLISADDLENRMAQREILVNRAKAAGANEREIVITGGDVERLTALCEAKERSKSNGAN